MTSERPSSLFKPCGYLGCWCEKCLHHACKPPQVGCAEPNAVYGCVPRTKSGQGPAPDGNRLRNAAVWRPNIGAAPVERGCITRTCRPNLVLHLAPHLREWPAGPGRMSSVCGAHPLRTDPGCGQPSHGCRLKLADYIQHRLAVGRMTAPVIAKPQQHGDCAQKHVG